MTPEDKVLTMAAARVARSAPDSWQQLLEALKAYSSVQTNNCIMSPMDILPVTQGRAQAVARVLGIFAECIPAADKLEDKRR